jgi:hypothetical protein
MLVFHSSIKFHKITCISQSMKNFVDLNICVCYFQNVLKPFSCYVKISYDTKVADFYVARKWF